MKIYEFRPTDERNCFITKTVDGANYLREKLSYGEFVKESNKLLTLDRSINFDVGKEKYDIPWLSFDGILCREKAYKLFDNCFSLCGSWTSLNYEKERFYYFSTTKVLDALDDKLSEYEMEGGIKIGIDKYVFKDIDYSKYPIFRISELPTCFPVVTESFVKFVRKNKLNGIEFFEKVGWKN